MWPHPTTTLPRRIALFRRSPEEAGSNNLRATSGESTAGGRTRQLHCSSLQPAGGRDLLLNQGFSSKSPFNRFMRRTLRVDEPFAAVLEEKLNAINDKIGNDALVA